MPIQFEGLTLYTADELSEKLSVSTATISRMLREGHIRGRKVARKWFVTEEALRNYFEGNSWSRNWVALERMEKLLLEAEEGTREIEPTRSSGATARGNDGHRSELRELIMKQFRESLEREAPDSPWLQTEDS